MSRIVSGQIGSGSFSLEVGQNGSCAANLHFVSMMYSRTVVILTNRKRAFQIYPTRHPQEVFFPPGTIFYSLTISICGNDIAWHSETNGWAVDFTEVEVDQFRLSAFVAELLLWPDIQRVGQFGYYCESACWDGTNIKSNRRYLMVELSRLVVDSGGQKSHRPIWLERGFYLARCTISLLRR